MPIYLKVTATAPNVGTPTPEDLKLINRLTLRPMEASELYVVRMILSSDNCDLDGEAMTPEILEDFRTTIIGKGLLLSHEWKSIPVGTFFKSELVPQSDGSLFLYASAYLPRANKAAQEVIGLIESGVARAVSIGFSAPSRTPVTDPNTGASWIAIGRGPNGEHGTALEGSLVFCGSNPDSLVVNKAEHAMMVKSFQLRMSKQRSDFRYLLFPTS